MRWDHLRPIWNRVKHKIYNASKNLSKAFSHVSDNHRYIWWDRAGGPLDPEGWGAAQLHKGSQIEWNAIIKNSLTSWEGKYSGRVTASPAIIGWLYPIRNPVPFYTHPVMVILSMWGGGAKCPFDLLTRHVRGGGQEEHMIATGKTGINIAA